jgi:uncharacterized protein DUF4154
MRSGARLSSGVCSQKSPGTFDRPVNSVLLRLHFALVLTIGLLAAGRQEGPADEYQVKAAFLYNFAKFVEWPDDAFASPSNALPLCVLGEDPFGRAIDDVLSGKKVEGRALTLRRLSDARQAKGCRILFVSSSEPRSVLSVLASVNESGVLTVGESNSAVSEGMIINFILEGSKIRFVINTAAAEREKLRFSSRLLSLAIIVKK